MKLFLLNGSLAQKSHTFALLNYIQEISTAQGVEVKLWDLRMSPIPFVKPEYHHDPTQNPDQMVQKFVQAVDEADAIILGTPLYHGSYSGVLKNALDNLRGDALKNKWTGLVGNASNIRAFHVSFSHLRQVVNSLEGYTAQMQVGSCKADYEESADGFVLKDEGIKERCSKLVGELVRLELTKLANSPKPQ